MKMTKKELVDLMAYVFILAHNNQANDVITEQQFDKLMQACKDSFGGDEAKAINFIKTRASKLVGKLAIHETK